MPEISRALKRGDRAAARHRLSEVLTGSEVVDLALAQLEVSLTRAQYVCVWGIACGLSIAEIGEHYHRHPETVKSHLSHAAAALGWNTRAHGGGGSRGAWSVAECYRRGIFDSERELMPLPRSAWP